MFKKFFSLFAALTLSVGLSAAAPANVESVDLGLPSGLKWATFNVGATAPEGYGDYFAWGETEPYYSSQAPLTWKTGKETGYSWQSYCDASDYIEWSTAPYDATTKILKPEFDAATANWGSDWHMPTKAELDELKNNCTWTWTADYNGTGIKGYIVASKAEGNTNSIFLPASGYYNKLSLKNAGSEGDYWSASINEFYSGYASDLSCASSYVGWNSGNRNYGRPVRPVTTKLIVPGSEVGEQFVDTISGLKFKVTAVGEANTVKVISNGYKSTSYTVPDTVKYNNVDFAVTEIGEYAFNGRSALLSITIPEGVTTIGEYAFQWCESLQSVTLPTSLTTIGEKAFEGCRSLPSITIPASVATIGIYAFAYCTSLASVTLSPGVTTIGEKAFEGCSSLPSITIPASVTTIGRLAFSSCSGLQSVTLSEGLTTIGEGAFSPSGLTSVTIPASVTEIVETAFYNCTALASVTFLGNACQDAIGNNTFYNVGSTTPATLVLPDNWTGIKPDKQGNWYGGKFNLSSTPTALPTLFGDGVKGNKLIHNGQLLIRKGNKSFSILGREMK